MYKIIATADWAPLMVWFSPGHSVNAGTVDVWGTTAASLYIVSNTHKPTTPEWYLWRSQLWVNIAPLLAVGGTCGWLDVTDYGLSSSVLNKHSWLNPQTNWNGDCATRMRAFVDFLQHIHPTKEPIWSLLIFPRQFPTWTGINLSLCEVCWVAKCTVGPRRLADKLNSSPWWTLDNLP